MRLSEGFPGVTALVVVVSALSTPAALANSQTYTGGNCATPGGCTGNSFGTLMPPATVTFADNSLTSGTSNDDWFFTVPQVLVSGTVSGAQVDLSNFAVQGTIESFSLFAVGNPTPLVTVGGGGMTSFSQMILDPSVSQGNYYLEVQAWLNPGSIGNYSGTLQVAAVPLPAAGWLLASGLGLMGARLRRRPRTA